MAESAEHQESGKDFDRDPDLASVKANAKTNLSSKAVSEEVFRIAAKCAIQDNSYFVIGEPISRWVAIRLKGTPNLAAAKAKEFFDSQNHETTVGKIERDRVLVKDQQGQVIQVLMGPDKSNNKRTTEILTKKLFSVLQPMGVDKARVIALLKEQHQRAVPVQWSS